MIDIYYASQFINNEKVSNDSMNVQNKLCTYITDKKDILSGTMVGTIYHDDVAVQTFIFNPGFVATNICTHEPFTVIAATLNHTTGEIVMEWNKAPNKKTHLVVSYEYEYK